MTAVDPSAVSIGVDAAVVAAHQVAIRGPGIREDFKVAPTLAGLARLAERLTPYAGSMVVAEPTGGTWVALGHAVEDAGCRFALVKNTDSARLRKAIAGANKTDVIDAEMLAHCPAVLGVRTTTMPSPAVWGLRRALLRRHRCTVEAHRSECRLWSLAMWAFPDVWRACGGHQLAQPILGRWPELAGLARAHLDSIAEIVAAHSRDRDPRRRAERIRDGARGWLLFWKNRVDVDLLAWEVAEILDDIDLADSRQRAATAKASAIWHVSWPDDLLTSVPGIGPICAAATRAWWADAELSSPKQAAAFIGLNPSNWESGLSASPSRPITKEGPPALRLAYYQAANVARRHDPDLAAFYRKLMVERHHNHIKANTAVARKLACRAWAVLDSGQPYQLRDLDGRPIDAEQAKAICANLAVPQDVRQRSRAHQQRGRLSPS
jgi:transposase